MPFLSASTGRFCCCATRSQRRRPSDLPDPGTAPAAHASRRHLHAGSPGRSGVQPTQLRLVALLEPSRAHGRAGRPPPSTARSSSSARRRPRPPPSGAGDALHRGHPRRARRPARPPSAPCCRPAATLPTTHCSYPPARRRNGRPTRPIGITWTPPTSPFLTRTAQRPRTRAAARRTARGDQQPAGAARHRGHLQAQRVSPGLAAVGAHHRPPPTSSRRSTPSRRWPTGQLCRMEAAFAPSSAPCPPPSSAFIGSTNWSAMWCCASAGRRADARQPWRAEELRAALACPADDAAALADRPARLRALATTSSQDRSG